jgi:hypothetical protein
VAKAAATRRPIFRRIVLSLFWAIFSSKGAQYGTECFGSQVEGSCCSFIRSGYPHPVKSVSKYSKQVG